MLRVERYRPELVTAASLSNKSVSAAELKELMDFPNLQLLVLTMAQLPVGAGQQIASLKTLRELDLAGTNVTDADLRLLTGLTRLEALDLMGTGIADAGLEAVTELRALKTVSLARTRVTANGLADLRQRRPDLKIER